MLKKMSIYSRIQKKLMVATIIFPLDGQTQGEVVVGTTNEDNLEDPVIFVPS
jgi:hypothetical protein